MNTEKKTNAANGQPDPFADPALRPPGLWRTLCESFGGKRRLLDVIQVEVTSLCPGKCLYCPHTTMRDQWKGRHMRAETYARLWPLLLECGRAHLQGWGEPFLHPRFIDMVALARRAGCDVSTTTCGLHMTGDLAAALVDSGLDIIAFSLAGTTAESNDVLRAGVPFERVAAAIRLLQETRKRKNGVHLEIHIAYLMLADRTTEIRALPDLMRELDVHAAVVSTLDYIPSPELAAEAFAPHEREKIAAARQELEQAAGRAASMGLSLYYALPDEQPGPACLENPARNVYVDAEGNLSPCIYLNLPADMPESLRRVYGSCLHDNPVNVWQSDAFAAFRAALASNNPDPLCRDCPKRYAEGGRQE